MLAGDLQNTGVGPLELMFKRLYKTLLPLGASLMLALATTACQKRCQALETTSFKSLVDAQWRLVESTDPQVINNLNNYNFTILTFNRDNTGDLKRVVDNSQYDIPVYNLLWAPNPMAHLIRIQFSTVTAPTQPGQQVQAANPGDGGTTDYEYYLGTQLEMYDLNKGYYYRYVPFKGVVNPDTVCSF